MGKGEHEKIKVRHRRENTLSELIGKIWRNIGEA